MPPSLHLFPSGPRSGIRVLHIRGADGMPDQRMVLLEKTPGCGAEGQPLPVCALRHLRLHDRTGVVDGQWDDPILQFFFLHLCPFYRSDHEILEAQRGFRSNPMDFLILFVALVVPALPVVEIQSYRLGIMGAKMVALFFSYEVLLGELRGQFGKVTVFTLAALAVIVGKGLLGY